LNYPVAELRGILLIKCPCGNYIQVKSSVLNLRLSLEIRTGY
jgi:hypothetical protein